MAQSLGLTAYRALARRGEVRRDIVRPERPSGELIWVHAAEPGNSAAIIDLAIRLGAARADATLLLTTPEQSPPLVLSTTDELTILADQVPGEHPEAVANFLDHWQPDLCLWTWGALRPNLVLDAADRGCRMILADVDSNGFDGRRDRWLPDLTKAVLSRFTTVLTRSEAGKKRLVQLGVPRQSLETTSPLLAGGRALPCADADFVELSEQIAGRPVWFAVWVHPQEVSVILEAHRQATRLSHRLLLILSPAAPDQAKQAAQAAMDARFVTLNWNDGAEPEETTQVLLVEDVADRGLFFRLAPVSFLGSSLVPGQDGCDPFEAAALGSAVLYGPKVGRFMPSYSRLVAAGAARIVNDASALGTAVSRLIAPDQAATMAHAGWEVISEGSELTDHIIALVQEALDASEVPA